MTAASAMVAAGGQVPPRRWLAVGGELGIALVSPRTHYQDSWRSAVRLGGGVRLGERFELEATAELADGCGYAPFGCEAFPGPCPQEYKMTSVDADVGLDMGPKDRPARLRLLVGAGVIRLTPHGTPPAFASVTTLGLNLGLQQRLVAWRHADLAVAGRGVLIPDAQTNRIWVIQLGLAGRVF